MQSTFKSVGSSSTLIAPPFPISSPRLLLDPNPGYPAVSVFSDGSLKGSYLEPSVSVSGAATVSLSVPEPFSLCIFGTALVGFAFMRRRELG